MAQNAQTVTAPNPTPPTNMSFTGQTPPSNVPNYTKNTYNDPKNWGVGTITSPPPYFDDGSQGAGNAYAAVTSALASGSAATAGGCEGTYPGTGTAYANPNNVGAVPASANSAHEEVGNVTTYNPPNATPPTGAAAHDVLVFVSDGPVMNTLALREAGPNAAHASYVGAGASTLTGVTGAANVAGPGKTTTVTATGTNFRRDSVLYVNGVAQNTTYVSATTLTAGSVPNKQTTGAGNIVCYVVTGGVATANVNWANT